MRAPKTTRRPFGSTSLRDIHGWLAATLLLLASSSAWALQPLTDFLDKASSHPDNREALATVAQREAEASTAFGRLLPAFSAQGKYTRNQYEVALSMGEQSMTVQPYNQWDATLQLDVPLVDLAGHSRYRAQQALTDAARAAQDASALEVQKQVVRNYYQVLGATSLVESSLRSLEVAKSNAKLVADRTDAGVASELDLQRANARIERANQDVSDAQLVLVLARRNLATLTGLVPLPVLDAPSDELHEEAPLATWLDRHGTQSPAVRQAKSQVQAAEANATAARLGYLPTLSANAQERLTNATGFSGRASSYSLAAVLSWKLDFTLNPTISAQVAAADAAQARQDRARLTTMDQIHESWQRVKTGIVKCRAARAEATSARKASTLAADRYAAGVGTQLDVIQAERDAFSADVASIQADAELASARALLRLNAGQQLTLSTGTQP
jgi:outer membrane protein TolC